MAVDSTPTDHGVCQMNQRIVDVVSFLVTHPQAAEALLPANRALDHPPMTTQAHAALDAPPCDARRDAPLPQLTPQGLIGVCLVGVQLCGALARPTPLAPHRSERVHDLQHPFSVRYYSPRRVLQPAAIPGGLPVDGVSCPICPDPSGSVQPRPFFTGCAFSAHAHRIKAGTAPVDLAVVFQPAQ